MKKIKIYVSFISFLIGISFYPTVTIAAELPEAKEDKGLVIFLGESYIRTQEI